MMKNGLERLLEFNYARSTAGAGYSVAVLSEMFTVLSTKLQT
jgi:hypothetical protein